MDAPVKALVILVSIRSLCRKRTTVQKTIVPTCTDLIVFLRIPDLRLSFDYVVRVAFERASTT